MTVEILHLCQRMRSSLILSAILISSHSLQAQHVTIIESLTGDTWAVQDTAWRFVAEQAGYTATIVPQSALDDVANFNSTDILIVASGTISYDGTNHQETLNAYVMSGKPAYVQAEYTTEYPGSIQFQALMNALEADFAWSNTVSGSLDPVNILGTLANTPNDVAQVSYFNYGLAGGGEDVEPIAEYGGNYIGFCYEDPLAENGTVITLSDEDWAWMNLSPQLMENILYKLGGAPSNIPTSSSALSAISVSPNPCKDIVRFSTSNTSLSEVILYDRNGNRIYTQEFTGNATISTRDLAAGLYFYSVGNVKGQWQQGRFMKE